MNTKTTVLDRSNGGNTLTVPEQSPDDEQDPTEEFEVGLILMSLLGEEVVPVWPVSLAKRTKTISSVEEVRANECWSNACSQILGGGMTQYYLGQVETQYRGMLQNYLTALKTVTGREKRRLLRKIASLEERLERYSELTKTASQGNKGNI